MTKKDFELVTGALGKALQCLPLKHREGFAIKFTHELNCVSGNPRFDPTKFLNYTLK